MNDLLLPIAVLKLLFKYHKAFDDRNINILLCVSIFNQN